jgi:mono/diheme cytochrome c family protein
MHAIKLIFLSTLLVSASFGASAQETWDNECMRCHGANGDGRGKGKVPAGIKDYTSPKVQSEFSDAGLLKNLLLGIQAENGKYRMPAYKDKLTVAEAKDLVTLIRSFKK